MSADHFVFWYAAGAMSALAACTLAVPLYRRLSDLRGARRALVPAAIVFFLVTTAGIGLYKLWGGPESVTASVATQPPHTAAVGTPASSAARVDSIDDVAGKLAARLNRDGGSAADWNLLAQSYDFLGRPDDARAARAHATGTGATAAASKPPPAPLVSPETNQMLQRAEKYRLAHDYGHAVELYETLRKRGALTADAWANFADAVASKGSAGLSGAPADYLQHALALDPDHPKALWLQASFLDEQHRYVEAEMVWRHLSSLLPPESPDFKVVEANLAEAQQLAAVAAGAPTAAPAAGGVAGSTAAAIGGTAEISGVVDIAPALREQAKAGATLFVFARSSESRGPPLAVVRTSVDQWPVKFSLNDSQAMLPQRKLSDFSSVVVEARISIAGQPVAQRGDLQGNSGSLNPRTGKPIRVVINDVVG